MTINQRQVRRRSPHDGEDPAAAPRSRPRRHRGRGSWSLVGADAFERGPRELSRRGTRDDDRHAFVVEDGAYASARWPGDPYLIARRLLARLG
jgi:hypothetical protein